MDERRLKSAAVAALAVVVVGVAAATLGETTQRSQAPGPGDAPSGGLGPSGGGFSPEVPPPSEPLPILTAILLVLGAVLLFNAVLFARHTLKEVARAAALSALVLAALWLVNAFLDLRFPVGGGGDRTPGVQRLQGTATGVGAGGTSSGGGALPETAVLALLVAAVLGMGALTVLVRRSGSSDAPDDADADEETLAAIGRSAGRAADRIAGGGATVDNEVYRAWKEMTDHLDVEDPGARTPGEFRAAARDAGMTAGDVDALTDLFEEVRYGGASPTEERERAAAAALRRIEERYADEEGSS